MPSHGLHLGFTAWVSVGFGCHGEVIVQEKVQKQLHKYQIQTGGTYEEIWNWNMPKDTSDGQSTAMTATGRTLIQPNSWSPTLVLNLEGKCVDILQHEGLLLACLPPARPAYRYICLFICLYQIHIAWIICIHIQTGGTYILIHLLQIIIKT